MELTRLTPDRYEEFLDMIHDFYLIDDYPFDRGKKKRLLIEGSKENVPISFFFIYVNEEVIGYCILGDAFNFEAGGWECFLEEFYIKDEHQGKKYGHEFLEYLSSRAKEENIKWIRLEVEIHNDRAKHLYSKVGFEERKLIHMCKKID